jgi:hypothetical protein
VKLDGEADFTMTRGKGRHLQKYLVRLAPWNQWMATPDCLERFGRDLRREKQTRGVYVAPGGFAASALHRGRQFQVETVDAHVLAARLNELPETHSLFFYETGTLGDSHTPTCPVCMKKMATHLEDPPPPPSSVAALPDLSFRSYDIVAEGVAARRIEIHHGAEVYFLRGVRARDVIVHGLAAGNFVCDGCMLLNPGANLEGTVAARSIVVRPGAVLNGETRILKAPPEPFAVEPASALVWRCANPKGRSGCGSRVFRRH